MLSIALPKGRLGDRVYRMLEQAGYRCADFFDGGRKLIIEDKANDLRYFLVKPSDVAIYVERGAADVGVVGKDILLESSPDVYELLNLNIGRCRVAVAGPNDFVEDKGATLRVATKFVNIVKRYYASKNRDMELIHLNGSIELAPILGLSDVIVDIVETGTTLKENNLRVFCDIVDISARLIANKSSYKFKTPRIDEMTEKLKEVIPND